mmetsp:Transcript_2650/g.2893  ORF Transcript_2650/g.2893 Transcript_2650/m.2893 type:complete len:142 (+) Transcript_2650:109-534(+)
MYHLEQKERHTVHSSKKNIPKTQNPNKVKFGCVGTTFQQKAFCVGGWCGTVRVVCRLPSPFERMGFPPCDSVELPRELGLDTKAFHTPKKKECEVSTHTTIKNALRKSFCFGAGVVRIRTHTHTHKRIGLGVSDGGSGDFV